MTARNSAILWFAAYFVVHLAARGFEAYALEATSGVQNGFLWLRGVFSDAAMAALAALISVLLARIRYWVPYVIFVVWCVFLAGNREYIGEWQSNLAFMDALALTEVDFIRGSVLTSRLMMTSVGLIAVGMLAFWGTRRMVGTIAIPRKAWPAWGAALLVGVLPVTPPELWIQENVLEENVRQIINAALSGTSLEGRALAEARQALDKLRAQDLKGRLMVTQKPGVNVLMISIESLSETTMQKGWLPNLQKLADANLHYTQFIFPNIVTARGLYGIYCGDLTCFDRYGHDRIARHITDQHKECLPLLLNREGYHTIYMQGANLDFQDKLHEMPAAGFDEEYGNGQIGDGQMVSEWGIDDASLYTKAENMIDNLEAQGTTPWMIGIMTVSTHHPYYIEPTFMPELTNVRERSYRFADDAISKLVGWLDSTGRLENTLVIITGDESRETRKAQTPLASTFTRNHGLLVILTPHKEQMLSDDSFMQTDLKLSVLDYVGVRPPQSVSGRSVFRQYDHFRPVVFGDYAQNSLYALWHPDQFTVCNTEKWECKDYQADARKLFDDATPPRHPQLTDSSLMHALFSLNRQIWGMTP